MSTMREVTVPDIGEFKNIPIIEILVKPGDRVTQDSPLIVLESDKATLDVPSPERGIVRELKIAIGDRVSLGSTILTLETGSDETPPTALSQPTPHVVTPAVTTVSPPIAPVAMMSSYRVSNIPPIPADARRQPAASPSVRRFARELGVDLFAVTGSGPRGRILKEDLQGFVKMALTAAASKPITGGGNCITLAPWPQIDFSKFGTIDRAPLTKIRKIAGENLSRNWVGIPHVTNFEDADITDLEAFRQQVNAEGEVPAAKVTMLAFLIKATATTLRRYPEFNSSLDGDELILKRYFHIGFAADTPNGLVVPVIRDVDTKGISQIASDTATLAEQAREGKLKMADMQGGCFTISSLGGIGGTGFTPIINAPEVAILGVTRAQMRPVWSGKEFQPRLILPLTLSWDHRVIDGVAAARFLVHLSRLLCDFRRLLL
jgi:pyruvate dehydrogenase E2 component (dihydrolipoamide acetyltransferase)